MAATQTLICRVGNHVFTREASKGRPPVFCDEHRGYGPAKPTAAPVQASTAPIVTAAAPEAPKAIAGTHKAFPTLLAVAKARVPALLVGPAGSGKTTAGRQVAKHLNLEFESESCNVQMTKYDLLGFVDANGVYRQTALVRLFTEGGVFLLDEIDASNPAVLVALNMLAACEVGETVTFPNGESVERHADFILIAGANTFGDGASDEYVGREQLDAATLDRFATICWDYDERLEFLAAGADAAEWVSFVQRVRKAAKRASLSILVTPRASINGAKLLRSGLPREQVAELTIWKGVDRDTRRSLEALIAA